MSCRRQGLTRKPSRVISEIRLPPEALRHRRRTRLLGRDRLGARKGAQHQNCQNVAKVVLVQEAKKKKG